MRVKIVSSFMLCLALAACMGAAGPAPEPAPASTPEPVVEAEAPTAAEAPQLVQEAPPPPPAPEPEILSGLTPADVQALMGEPTFVRRDDNVQTMLYEDGDCVFEIVFVEPTTDDHFTARKLSARDHGGTETDLQACLAKQLPGGTWLKPVATNEQTP